MEYYCQSIALYFDCVAFPPLMCLSALFNSSILWVCSAITGFILGNLSVQLIITAIGLDFNETINTSDFFLPIGEQFDIEIEDSEFTLYISLNSRAQPPGSILRHAFVSQQ